VNLKNKGVSLSGVGRGWMVGERRRGYSVP